MTEMIEPIEGSTKRIGFLQSKYALDLKIFMSAICQNKVQELGELNQALRNRDKMKDDAIAQLSDQVMALTARMEEFERIIISVDDSNLLSGYLRNLIYLYNIYIHAYQLYY